MIRRERSILKHRLALSPHHKSGGATSMHIVLARLSVCRAPSGVEGWIGGETSLEDEDVGGTVYKYASR
jgi:hypothetical protein